MTKYQRPFLYLLLGFTLSACTQTAEDPKTIADKYWQFMQTGNISEAKKLSSTNSHHVMQQHSSRVNTATQINSGETTAIVTTTITTINPDNNTQHTETFNTVLVLQQGQWKVDVDQSQIPAAPDTKHKNIDQLTEELSESMQENIDSMDEAVSQGLLLLNEALSDGSKEMGDSLLQMMNELNETMQDSIGKMKQRREQQMQEQKPQSQPDPNQGEGMI